MKILFLCHRFPYPPDGGGKIRALKMLEHLASRHEVHLVSMIRNEHEAAGVAELERLCASVTAPYASTVGSMIRVLRAVLTRRSLSEGYFGPRAVTRAVRDLCVSVRFDRIIVHSSSVGPHVLGIAGVPRLMDFCDVDSEKWRMLSVEAPVPASWVFRYEKGAVARLEKQLASEFEAVTLATQSELDSLLIHAEPKCADWFPNGVDLRYFRPSAEPYDPNAFCFVGRMDYRPNIECVLRVSQEILPAIRRHRPSARFIVVGAAPTSEVIRLRQIPGVEVTGTVDDVRPYVRRSAAMVAPLAIARGTQNKVLEALAMGVPVITSEIVARGLNPKLVAAVAVTHDSRDVIDATLACMNEPRHRRMRSVAGLRAVRSLGRWKDAMRRMDAIIDRMDPSVSGGIGCATSDARHGASAALD